MTGQVDADLVVEVDVGKGTSRCARCASPAPVLQSGDRVTAALYYYYQNHSWEVHGVYCANHAPATVADAMDVRGEEQAIVEATLEASACLPPYGDALPDALTLGSVELVDRSTTADGWEHLEETV